MRRLGWFLSCLVFALQSSSNAQNPAPSPESIKDPKAILEAVQASYDFENPALKPWYLKATYELYAVDGKSKEEGTYERWWRSPKEYRSTWARGGNLYSEWHTSDGRVYQLASGHPLYLFETNIPELLLSPLPKSGEYDPAKDWLERYTVEWDKVKVPCVRVVGKEASSGASASPSYCFDPKVPIVLLHADGGGMSEAYGQYARVQNLALPRSVAETVDNRRLLTVTLDSVASVDASDRALAPPPDATTVNTSATQVSARVMNGKRTRGLLPEYPQKAKDARIPGTVSSKRRSARTGRFTILRQSVHQILCSPRLRKTRFRTGNISPIC
ncbi:MAG: hypothetical protein WBD46_18005 [Acidobacteriaceae bacterium]